MKKVVFAILFLSFVVSAFAQQTGSFTDARDGKKYKTVKIGNQWWMAENLAYKASSGCRAYDNSVRNVSAYGYLYNFETAQNVCPSGWHLPSGNEWNTLVDFIGGNEAGNQLKSKTGWSENYNGTNDYGFNAFPAGLGYSDGDFLSIGIFTKFWSSTQKNANNGRGMALYQDEEISTGYSSKKNYCSVRCLKD